MEWAFAVGVVLGIFVTVFGLYALECIWGDPDDWD